jgi:hypothetical protein
MSPIDIVICVASGPSFSQAQADYITAARMAQRCRVFVVSDNYQRVANADLLYSCDLGWWTEHIEAVLSSGFDGELWTQHKDAAKDYGLCLCLPDPACVGLPQDREHVSTGGNGGHQTMVLARNKRARRIIMVGYDYQRTGGKAHWFGEHPTTLSRSQAFTVWLDAIPVLYSDLCAEGIEVINASEQTAIRCIPRMPLEKALPL